MNTPLRLALPARINMLGNPADGNEGDHATLSAAIALHARLEAVPAERFTVEVEGEAAAAPAGDPPFDLAAAGGAARLALAGVNRLWIASAAFRAAWERAGSAGRPGLRLASDVPAQSGLGGSSLFVLLALAAMRSFFRLDRREHHLYRLAEWAQQAEELDLGITCGFADRYLPLFGGLAYVDYRGKLWHRGPEGEPLATVERLDPWVPEFPVVIAYTGVEGDSGDVHRVLRERFLAEARASEAAGERAGPLARIMEEVGATAWRGKAALLRGDWEEVGGLMNENHRLVDRFMRRCGFESGAGAELNLLIERARDAGALGAKLTGAGGRGSVFVVAAPGQEEAMAEALRAAAREAGLARARVFRAELDTAGLTES